MARAKARAGGWGSGCESARPVDRGLQPDLAGTTSTGPYHLFWSGDVIVESLDPFPIPWFFQRTTPNTVSPARANWDNIVSTNAQFHKGGVL